MINIVRVVFPSQVEDNDGGFASVIPGPPVAHQEAGRHDDKVVDEETCKVGDASPASAAPDIKEGSVERHSKLRGRRPLLFKTPKE